MSKKIVTVLSSDDYELSLSEFCRTCGFNADEVLEYIEYLVIEPQGSGDTWRFNSICIRRARKAKRLQRDLGLNISGVALTLDLLEEIEDLRLRLRRYES